MQAMLAAMGGGGGGGPPAQPGVDMPQNDTGE